MTSKLEIQELVGTSCKVLKLGDASSYNPDIDTTDGVLEVTPPGFSCPVEFAVLPGFSITLNSSTLNIAPAVTSEDLINLPDGVYKYKYSIAPNDQLYVEYSSLRECAILQKYYQEVCKLFASRIRVTPKAFQLMRRNLIWIKELIDAAKYKVEECLEEEAGIELYNEANRLLDHREGSYC